jgi:hypothetical protein
MAGILTMSQRILANIYMNAKIIESKLIITIIFILNMMKKKDKMLWLAIG